MSRAISINVLTDNVIDGIKNAFNKYQKYSNGCWLNHSPEYFVTCEIADSISNIDGAKFLTLESNVKSILYDSGAISKGKLHSKLRPNGRSDIILWHGKDDPRAIIEVKSPLYCMHDTALEDIRRIDKMLTKNKNNSSLQFGLFAFYTAAVTNSRFMASDVIGEVSRLKKGRLASFLSKSIDEAKGCNVSIKYHKSIVGDDAWAAGCLIFKPKSDT